MTAETVKVSIPHLFECLAMSEVEQKKMELHYGTL